MTVPFEVAASTIAFYAAWVLAVAGVYLGARTEAHVLVAPLPADGAPLVAVAGPGRWTEWNRRLWEQWPAAAVLAVLFLLASVVRGQFNPIAIGVFCQALVGLALARGIQGFEALPAVAAVRIRRGVARALLLMAAIGVAANLVANVLGSIGLSAGAVFGEASRTGQAASSFHVNAFQAFFVFLGSAGVAEEVLFRLLAVTIVWRLTGRAWIGVIGGALIFAAYHFTPLDGLYRTFWQFPIGALVSNVLVGAVWGVVYVRRGLETAITGHTLLDWVTFVAFVR